MRGGQCPPRSVSGRPYAIVVVMSKQSSAAFKAQVMLEILKEERTVNEIAAAYGVHPTQLTRWKGQVVDGPPSLFDSEKKAVVTLEAAHEEELERLYAEIGCLTTQLEWLGEKAGLRSAKG